MGLEACPACLYTLAASAAYPWISRILEGKLSSARGFLLVYSIALYAPLALQSLRASFWAGLAVAFLGFAAALAVLSGSGEVVLRSARSSALALGGFAASLAMLVLL